MIYPHFESQYVLSQYEKLCRTYLVCRYKAAILTLGLNETFPAIICVKKPWEEAADGKPSSLASDIAILPLVSSMFVLGQLSLFEEVFNNTWVSADN